jgi:hypothetical protein
MKNALLQLPEAARPPEPDATVATETDGAGEFDRLERIAIAAYYRAQARGFEPGHELEDWLQAESEVDSASES